ncbi:MAG: PEGA domain-containing protein [Deltaproteobacteria bacterium]|nr:PEGA domain-containing protein [Deltaproteobacteria bacterium]
MTRALSSICTALLLVGLLCSQAFAGKPTVAVLGLEVYDATGQIDQGTTQVAKELTDALRSRAKMPSGPYQFQPGSEKELIDEKLIKNCDNEAVACMSQIGKDLGADFLIYGRIEKKPDGFQVSVNLLNVNKKKFEKAKSPLTVPHAAAKEPQQVLAVASKAYNELVGVVSNGTLIVRSNADRGTVLLDNEPKGSIASGSLTLSLPEGPYRLIVEADGFERSTEQKITVRSGETTTQSVQLLEMKKDNGNNTRKPDELTHTITGTTSTTKSNVWKPMFVASVIVGLSAGGFWGFSYYKEQSAADKVAGELSGNHPALSQSDCSNAMYKAESKSFKDACKYRDWTTYGIIGTGVGVALMAVTGYMAFGRGDSETSTRTGMTGKRVQKPTIAVTPILQPNGGGAAFRIDW